MILITILTLFKYLQTVCQPRTTCGCTTMFFSYFTVSTNRVLDYCSVVRRKTLTFRQCSRYLLQSLWPDISGRYLVSYRRTAVGASRCTPPTHAIISPLPFQLVCANCAVTPRLTLHTFFIFLYDPGTKAILQIPLVQ